MKVDKFQKSDVKKAIEDGKGIMSAIARTLGVDWKTAKKLIEMHDLKEELEIANESLLDFAENMLFKNIKEGKEASIFYYLNNKGKSRGYNVGTTIQTENPVTITVVTPPSRE